MVHSGEQGVIQEAQLHELCQALQEGHATFVEDKQCYGGAVTVNDKTFKSHPILFKRP